MKTGRCIILIVLKKAFYLPRRHQFLWIRWTNACDFARMNILWIAKRCSSREVPYKLSLTVFMRKWKNDRQLITLIYFLKFLAKWSALYFTARVKARSDYAVLTHFIRDSIIEMTFFVCSSLFTKEKCFCYKIREFWKSKVHFRIRG